MQLAVCWHRCCALMVIAGFLPAVAACAGPSEQAPTVIMDMDTVSYVPGVFGEEKKPVGTVELVEGKVGKACRFEFAADSRNGYFTAGLKPGPEWDEAAGISFWVKGDGSDSWGALEIIDANDFAFRYGYWFPIDSTEWRKIMIPWCDLIPELPKGQLVDPKSGYRPSNFGHLWLGKRVRWWEFPAHSFTIDQIQLEPSIALDATDYTPATGGLDRLLAKLKAKQPVTIVTMGDSLSDKHHWANRELLWSELLVQKLEDRYGGKVTLVNPAVGGHQLTHGLIVMPRWVKETPEPDLVTVWYGWNDWDDGMRGAHFREVLRFAVDRIRRLTGGKAEVLLLSSVPDLNSWNDRTELADAVRAVAEEKKTGLADAAAAFQAAGAAEDARSQLYAWDKVHLGEKGHQVTAETVLKAVAGGQ